MERIMIRGRPIRRRARESLRKSAGFGFDCSWIPASKRPPCGAKSGSQRASSGTLSATDCRIPGC
jgi:hypothetical protein